MLRTAQARGGRPLDARARRRIGVGLALASVASVATTLAPTPVAAESVAFGPGVWVGSAKYFGEVDEPTVSALAEAHVEFDLNVGSGEVLAGTLTASGEGTGIEAGAGASATLSFSMTATLSGPADDVAYSGPSTFKGTGAAGGFEVPIEFSGTVMGSIQPQWATCTQVGGDLAAQAEQALGATGVAVDAAGVFLATRIETLEADPGTYIPSDYTALVDDMQQAAEGDVTPEQLKELVVRIEVLNANIAGVSLCGDVPAGFEEGLVKDDFFYEQFTAIFAKILANPDAFSVYDLADFLTVAARVGAVGPSAPDPGGAGVLLAQFEQVLGSKLAVLNKDVPGSASVIVAIYVAAEQAGLTDLAAAAKAKL